MELDSLDVSMACLFHMVRKIGILKVGSVGKVKGIFGVDSGETRPSTATQG